MKRSRFVPEGRMLWVIVLLGSAASVSFAAVPHAPRSVTTARSTASVTRRSLGARAAGAGAPRAHVGRVGARRASALVVAPAPTHSGMVIGIDPETGVFGMPTPGQMQTLIPLGSSASPSRLPEHVLPGGGVAVDLQGQLQEYYVLRIGPDGKQRVVCTDEPAAVRKAIAAPASTPVLEDR